MGHIFTGSEYSDADCELALSKQVCFALYQAANRNTRLYGRTLAPHGLTFPQFQVLLALFEVGQCSIGKLCDTLDLDTSTITSVLKRLESNGFVTRFRDRVDERRVFAALTDKGRAFEVEARAIRRQCDGRVALSASELDAFRRVLRRFSNAIDLPAA